MHTAKPSHPEGNAPIQQQPTVTLHIVPHTHWDREWYLPFQEFRIKLVHLLDLLINLLEKDPSFTTFTLDGQSILLEDYLEIRPEQEETLKNFIREGRVSIGPWYVLPDEFLVSPESLIRNLSLGRQICAQFEGYMEVGYLPDPFGHIGQLPQILEGFGIGYAVLRRGLAEEPLELWWESPNGSRVMTSYLRDGYDNAARLPVKQESFDKTLTDRFRSLKSHSAVSHLLLLNGTDHHEPQPEIPALIAQSQLKLANPILSNFEEYWDAVESEVQSNRLKLPVIKGELRDPRRHHLLNGVLSSRVRIKQRNHTCETLLESWAEPFAVWAEHLSAQQPDRRVWTGHLATPRVRSPKALLDKAWKILLQCHPHDSICGCSIDQVHEEMTTRFDQVEQIGEEVVRQSLTAIVESVNTQRASPPEAQSALVVFNSTDQAKSGIACGNLTLPAGLEPFQIVDSKGQLIHYRILERTSRTLADLDLDAEGLQNMMAMIEDGWVMGLSIQGVVVLETGDSELVDVILAEEINPNLEALKKGRKAINSLLARSQSERFRLLAHFATEVEIEIYAEDIPAHGYKTYYLIPSRSSDHPPNKAESEVIENEFIRVKPNQDGTLSVLDKRNGQTYQHLFQWRDLGDRGDSYTFDPVEGPPPEVELDSLRVIREGAKQSLVLRMTYQVPKGLTSDRESRSAEMVGIPIKLEAMIFPGHPYFDIVISLENLARDHRLQIQFPLPFPVAQAAYDGHFEIVTRSTRLPESDSTWIEKPTLTKPMRSFVAAVEGTQGLVIAARGLREASVSPDGVIAITLLRAFGWLSRDDLITRKGGAGPQIPVPGGQALGSHKFHLRVIPFDKDRYEAYRHAYAFQSEMRLMGQGLHGGRLPPRASFIQSNSERFRITTLKPCDQGEGMILRGVNLTSDQIEVQLESLFPLAETSLVRLDETGGNELAVSDKHILRLSIDAHAIVTLRLNPEAHFSGQF